MPVRPDRRRPGDMTLRLIVFAFAFSTLGTTWASAQLNPEIFVSAGGTAPSLEVGPGDNIVLTFIQDDEVFARFAPEDMGASAAVTSGVLTHANPAAYVATTGLATFAFEREPNTMGPHEGNEIFVQSGLFGTSINLSSSFSADREPELGGLFSRDVVWTRDLAVGSEIMISQNLLVPVAVASGAFPDLVSDPFQNRHLVYVRDGELYYRIQSTDVWGAEEAIPVGVGAVAAPELVVDNSGNLHIAYVQGGSLWYVRRDLGAAFSAPVLVSGSELGVERPGIFVGPAGLVLTFLRDNDVWKIQSAGSVFAPAINLTETPGVAESNHTVDLDSLGFLHLAYESGGLLSYRNEVTPPVADFIVSGSSGDIPLTVEFTSLSTGVIDARLWNFGDGGTSTLENPTYVYEESGNYSVSLTVTGPGGADTLVQGSLIQAADPSNFLTIAPVTVFQGQDDVFIPILATNSEPIQGFQLALVWDCTVFQVEEITVESTTVSALDPEFVIDNIDTVNCSATVGVVFDFLSPFDGRTLPPGVEQRVANVVADIPATALVGPSVIELQNGIGDPPIFNIFTVDGVSRLPILDSGIIEIVPLTFPPPIVFLRGDVDFNGVLEITDAIGMLEFLFSAGSVPPCQDSADANDSGTLDVSDVIAILSFLFSGGAVLPYPYPSVGLDPTDDPLGC